jgi:hypothetical protein
MYTQFDPLTLLISIAIYPMYLQMPLAFSASDAVTGRLNSELSASFIDCPFIYPGSTRTAAQNDNGHLFLKKKKKKKKEHVINMF